MGYITMLVFCLLNITNRIGGYTVLSLFLALMEHYGSNKYADWKNVYAIELHMVLG